MAPLSLTSGKEFVILVGSIIQRGIPLRFLRISFLNDRSPPPPPHIPQPSKASANLNRFRKKQVLFLIETSTSYGRDLLTGAARYAHEKSEWNLNIVPRGITETPRFIEDWHGDGVIARTPDVKTLKTVKKFGCPSVELLNTAKTEISCDEQTIAKLALDHFEEHCFEHVGFFSFGKTYWIIKRERHFKEEALQRGFAPQIFIEKNSRKDPAWYPLWNESYYSSLAEWLKEIPKPIAIFTANDHQAVHLINVCNNLGYRIPDTIAVLGINDDDHLCEILSPTLSSIDQNAQEIGYEAARLLDKKMKGEDCSQYEKRIFPLGVVARQSTNSFALSNPEVSRALHFIREFATSGICVTDVANEVNLTNRTLERYFKESLGHTPEREILMTKLRRAEWLLVSSNFSSNQISQLSGFSNEQYFCYLFKRERGVTPQQYRKKNKVSGVITWNAPPPAKKG